MDTHRQSAADRGDVTRSSRSTALVVKVPFVFPSIYYRPYAERLWDRSVLEWTDSQFCEARPADVRIIYLCESESERERLLASAAGRKLDGDGLGGETTIVNLAVRGGVHQCAVLAQSDGLQQLIIAGLSHAVLPQGIWRLLDCHRSMKAELTEAVSSVFQEPLFVIEASLVDELLRSRLPRWPDEVVPTAKLLRELRQKDVTLARDFRWIQLDLCKLAGIEEWRWPEAISLRSKCDVELLRAAIRERDVSPRRSFVDAWKQAAIVNQTRARARIISDGVPNQAGSRRLRILYGSNSSGFTGAQQSLCHLLGAIDSTLR